MTRNDRLGEWHTQPDGFMQEPLRFRDRFARWIGWHCWDCWVSPVARGRTSHQEPATKRATPKRGNHMNPIITILLVLAVAVPLYAWIKWAR